MLSFFTSCYLDLLASVPQTCWPIRRGQSTLIGLEMMTKDLERHYLKGTLGAEGGAYFRLVDHVLLLRYVAAV